MSTVIVGAGTIIFQDEGIGVYAGKYLEENYNFSDDVTIIDGGVLGFKLMTYYQEYDNVVILDTITMKDEKAGAIYNLPSSELLGLGSYKQTAHEVEIVEMLEICSLLGKMANVHIIGIVPKDIETVKIGLSSDMIKSFDNFIDAALNHLDTLHIKYTKNDKDISLKEIIHSYANPTSEYKNGNKTDNRV